MAPGPRATLAPMETLVRRLLVVEDEPLVASLLEEVLERARFEVRVAHDVLGARELLRTFDPDAALLDIALGAGPTGLDLAHWLHRSRPDVAIVFLTRHPDRRTAGLAAQDVPPGAGFLRKDMVTDSAYLLDALEQVLRDRPRGYRHDLLDDRPLHALTARQLEVLRLAAAGLPNARIAAVRGTSERAVELLLQSAFRTLAIPDDGSVNRRVEAVRRYVAVAGLPEPPDPGAGPGAGPGADATAGTEHGDADG